MAPNLHPPFTPSLAPRTRTLGIRTITLGTVEPSAIVH